MMQAARSFHHQSYRATAPTSPHHFLVPAACPPPGTPEYKRRMAAVGARYRAAGVTAIYLVHGTFVGPDAVGMLNELGRVLPSAGEALRRVSKQFVDRLTAESGNYTEAYAAEFERAINVGDQPPLAVRLFQWSSENNHVGRADGAIRLIDELAGLDTARDGRVLLWGHSHAGNVFALLSQLLGGDRAAVAAFFQAAQVYYKWPLLGCVDIPVWRRVRKLLERRDSPLGGRALDAVTFGTPILYGWNAAGYDRLLHFVYHRPTQGIPAYQAPFPPNMDRILRAADGDYVQQLGIAGTNVPPSMFFWRARWAEHRLSRLLQQELPPTSLVDRLRAGRRVSESGTTLLVDYGSPPGTVADHHAGHAVYTHPDWILFHAEEVARRFYGGA